ncbi:hypothetical protein SmJEL517_g05266 [Synchytrium microbalum]|uniref:Succinate dehydrogenase [ubiquinone] cytochrome b small subunit n=1 Tax=Synchytrium microbalum TaxID=1806994 RepID=A0A507BV44_9FUNG|nr:uncharacterized protein SmJEL517_g05266 [Synchytrium microbalum]TPX31392.1 hypothetical protein SmJEL517_g05266 [Synchytrium microbalum]
MATSFRMVSQLGLRTSAKFALRTRIANLSTGRVALIQASNVNQSAAAAVEHKSKVEGSYHWDLERALSLVSVPLIGGAFIMGPVPMIDLALGVVIPLHCHIGFEAIIQDYLPKRKFAVIYPVTIWFTRLASALVLYGVYQFNTNDVGLTALMKRIWTGKTAKIE